MREWMKRFGATALVLALMSGCGGGGGGSGDDGSGGDETPPVETIYTDDSIGLQWTSKMDARSWEEASAYCESLTYGDYSDWQLPDLDAYYSFHETNTLSGGMYWSNQTGVGDRNIYKMMFEVSTEETYINVQNPTNQLSFHCVRNLPDTTSWNGRWAYVDNGSSFQITEGVSFISATEVDSNHLIVTTVRDYDNWLDPIPRTRHLIRAGIPNVALSAKVAQVLGDSPSASIADRSTTFSGIGGLGVIVECINDNTCDDQSTTSEEDGSVNVEVPTGDVAITVTDDSGNSATFEVSVIGEETDAGVLTVTDQPYNFKSSISHGNDWRYFGYNDGEEAITYSKELTICNLGTQIAEGTSLLIEMDPSIDPYVRSFEISSSLTGLADIQGSVCRTGTLDFSFTRPPEDMEAKINITINEAGGKTWNDYVSLKLSQYPHHNLYFNSTPYSAEPVTLKGLLVAPGRNLLNVTFNSSSSNNYVRVPLVKTDEYEVVISAAEITATGTYMISSGTAPDTTKMEGFINSGANEDDNSAANATKLALYGGESIAYLSTRDIDFYKLADIPVIEESRVTIYTDENISVRFNTELNASTVTANQISLVNAGGAISFISAVAYDEATKSIVVDPSASLSAGTYTLSIGTGVESSGGFGNDAVQTAEVTVLSYPTAYSLVTETALSVNEFAIKGNYMYVTRMGISDIVIYDMSDRSNMVNDINFSDVLGTDFYQEGVSNFSSYSHMEVAGDLLVVSLTDYVNYNYEYKLMLFDVSDPIKPKYLSTTGDLGIFNLCSMSVAGTYVALSDDGDGTGHFKIVDISNTSAPVIAYTSGTYNGMLSQIMFSEAGDYLYVLVSSDPGNSEYFINIQNVSDLSNVIEERNITSAGSPANVAVMKMQMDNGILYYKSDESTGDTAEPDEFFKVTDPITNPVQTLVTLDSQRFRQFLVKDGTIYVADDANSSLEINDGAGNSTFISYTAGSANKLEMGDPFIYGSFNGNEIKTFYLGQ